LKGLFPGLAIGRGIPIPWLAANGLFPGLGIPGVVEAAFGSFGASVIELGASREVFGFASATGSSETAGSSLTGASSFALATALGLATFFTTSFGLASGNAARSFLATGGAIVEDPLLTYSPSSSNLAKATLVSMPSSLATS
jgi:hypothetical protein